MGYYYYGDGKTKCESRCKSFCNKAFSGVFKERDRDQYFSTFRQFNLFCKFEVLKISSLEGRTNQNSKQSPVAGAGVTRDFIRVRVLFYL